MPRIRSQHPGQWTDDEFVACSPLARLIVLAVRNEADDNGIFEWNPVKLKMRLLPADNCDVEALLEESASRNQIKPFEHEGKKYGAIRNFGKFQRVKKPVYIYPLPDELRAYVMAVGGDISSVRRRKWEEQCGRCFYCQNEITHYSKKSNSLEIDHKTPISRGGSEDESNLAATCLGCNRAKGDMNESEFRGWLAKNRHSPANVAIRIPNSEILPQRYEVGGRRDEVGGNNHHASKTDAPTVWDIGISLLARAGLEEKSARSFIGRLIKTHGEPSVSTVLAQCSIKRPADPRGWITKALQASAKNDIYRKASA